MCIRYAWLHYLLRSVATETPTLLSSLSDVLSLVTEGLPRALSNAGLIALATVAYRRSLSAPLVPLGAEAYDRLTVDMIKVLVFSTAEVGVRLQVP